MGVKDKVRERRAKGRRRVESVAAVAFVASLASAVLGFSGAAAILFAAALGAGVWSMAARNDAERAADREADEEASDVSF